MFSLRHLVCCGCDINFAQNIFLDDDKKRPLFTKCGHTLCSECEKSFPTCPICKEEVQPIENFAARNIFEEFRQNPVSVFKNWFNSEVTKNEPCSNCHENSNKLSLCITCGLESKHLYSERKTKKKELTRSEQQLVNMYYPRQKIAEPVDRIPSELNKFFESFGKIDADILPLEQCNSWIRSLEQQLEQLKNQKKCHCELVWDEMHSLSFGNQVEKYFVKAIIELGDQEIFECPLQLEELVEIRNKAAEMFKSKLFKIYTAFCWNHKWNRVCGLFDNLHKKPISCSNCGASTCTECLRDHSHKCSACGIPSSSSTEERKVNTDLLELIAFYKENCVNILEEWWSCEASQLQFCMSCSSNPSSYQLEVCVRCERIQKINAVKTKQNMKPRLETFPIRWQCSDCKNRLLADFAHHQCIQTGAWTRGCNHLLTRIHPTKKCDGNDLKISKGENNAVSLESIKNYEIAMKVATSKLVFRILKAGIEEKVKCRLRRADFLKIYGELRSQTVFYSRRMMAGKKLEEMEEASWGIAGLIEVLRNKWNNYRETECFCGKFWENSSKLSKIGMKEFLRRNQENLDPGVCSLEMYSNEFNCDSSGTFLYEESFA